jgi:hypothetical protein
MSEYHYYYVVPEKIVQKVAEIASKNGGCRLPYDEYQIICDAFAQVQAENPIDPTAEQFKAMSRLARIMVNGSSPASTLYHRALLKAFQIEMYFAPEPEVPEEIKNEFFWKINPLEDGKIEVADEHNRVVVEVYRRGQKAALLLTVQP